MLRASVLVPWAIPTVVAARLWAWLFNPDHGLLTRLLASEGANWLGTPGPALWAAILVDVWKTTPFVALILKKLHETLGGTFIYVTHDQAEAMTLSDRVALMNEGRLEQLGPARELYEPPRTLFAARFFGAPTLNVCPPATLGLPGDEIGLRFDPSRLLRFDAATGAAHA